MARALFEQIRVLASGGTSASYAEVGGPLLNPCKMLIINNQMDGDLMMSFDGVTDHLYIQAGQGMVLDFSSDKEGPSEKFSLSEGTTIWVRQFGLVDPTTGDIFVSVVYGKGE